jgi:DNA mismatch repair protein MSH3
MAPKNSQSSQPKSSQKATQPTISSFFTKKPSQTPESAPKPAPPPITDPNQDDDNDDDEDGLPVSQTIPVRKRAIDEDNVQETRRSSPSKRVRFDKGDSPRQASAPKPQKITDRTSKFLFSSSPPARDESRQDDEEEAALSQRQKERLHDKFVKKLGRPDSFAELRRRNKIISDDSPNANGEEGDGDEDEEDEPAQKPTKGKKGAVTKKASKLTPMEIQYLDIKRKHLDTIIVMEVGYKYKFFGEDARTASKALGIVCIPGENSEL